MFADPRRPSRLSLLCGPLHVIVDDRGIELPDGVQFFPRYPQPTLQPAGSSCHGRPAARRSTSHDGGISITSSASGIAARTCRAPCTSISSSVDRPAARASRTGTAGVP